MSRPLWLRVTSSHSYVHRLFQSLVNFYRVGAFSGASAILLGAFGAHALKARVTDVALLKTWETAAHYHLLYVTCSIFLWTALSCCVTREASRMSCLVDR